MSILQIVDLKKDYGEEPNITHALKGIQFEVDKGEFVGIMGASGSGKTTLLNCISTIDTATDGHIYLDGKDILEIREKDIARFRRESLGFIFQDFNLLDTLTIEENIALALTINKVSANKNRQPDSADRRKAEYHRYFEQISLSGFRRTETAMCLCKGNYQSSQTDIS